MGLMYPNRETSRAGRSTLFLDAHEANSRSGESALRKALDRNRREESQVLNDARSGHDPEPVRRSWVDGAKFLFADDPSRSSYLAGIPLAPGKFFKNRRILHSRNDYKMSKRIGYA
jgi:hypothetical protein